MPIRNFEPSKQELSHCLYIDNNLFRLLLRDPIFWEKFFDFFAKHNPNLFENVQFIFSWSQLLEDLDLGAIFIRIMEKLKFRKFPDQKPNESKEAYTKRLGSYLGDCFVQIKNAIAELPELQTQSLIDKIDNRRVIYAKSHAESLLEATIYKTRAYVIAGNHLDNLYSQIAWALLVSHPFITPNSTAQWTTRNAYFDALISCWHKRYLEGHELDFYRLADNRYSKYINHLSLNPHPKNTHLKPRADLCDGEIIHYPIFGTKGDIHGQRISVTSMTIHSVLKKTDTNNILAHRLAIGKQTLIDLQKTVADWCVTPTPGQIISVEWNPDTSSVTSANIIPFDIPFE